MKNFKLSRMQYGFALGSIVAIWTHFPEPRGLFVIALASVATAFRYRALDWKPSKAFVPLAIAVAGTILSIVLGDHTPASIATAHIWRGAALLAQLGMSLRAVLASSSVDPISPKQALAKDFLNQRRQTKRAVEGLKPQIEAQRRATESLNALRKELADHIASHGNEPSAERTLLMERLAEQTVLVRASTEDLQAGTEQLRAKSDALRSATHAWKNRNNKAA